MRPWLPQSRASRLADHTEDIGKQPVRLQTSYAAACVSQEVCQVDNLSVLLLTSSIAGDVSSSCVWGREKGINVPM